MTGVRELGLPQGNALALPRTTAVPGTVSSGKFDYVLRQSLSWPSWVGANNLQDHMILQKGRGIFLSRQNTTSYQRHTFNYSSNGISNAETTNFASLAAAGSLPSTTFPIPGGQNQTWSHEVSPTQYLYSYGSRGTFLVTWDRLHSTAPSTQQLTMQSGFTQVGSAFLLSDGNLCVPVHNSSSLRLHIFSPTLTYLRELNLVSFTNAFLAMVRKTSYGYLVGVMGNAVTSGVRTGAVTVNRDCTAVINATTSTVSNFNNTVNTIYLHGFVLGEEGAIVVVRTNNASNSATTTGVVFPVNSQGNIASIRSNFPASSSVFWTTTGGHLVLNEIFQGNNCSKYADTAAPYLYVDFTSTGTSFNSSSASFRDYIEGDVTSFISSQPQRDVTNEWMGRYEKTANGVLVLRDPEGNNAIAIDEEGGFLATVSVNSSLQLYQKVYR